MATLVSKQSKLLIEVMLTDSKIAEKVFENAHDKDKYKICTIEDDGNIILGKTSVKWWNRLLNCQDKITFESFALKIWDALVDASSGLANEAIMHGLSHEIIMNSVRTKEYNWVVNRLYDCWAHVAQKSEGFQEPKLPEGNAASRQERPVIVNSNEPRQIIINVQGEKKVIPFVDSVGDTLNLGLEFGVTGVRKLY